MFLASGGLSRIKERERKPNPDILAWRLSGMSKTVLCGMDVLLWTSYRATKWTVLDYLPKEPICQSRVQADGCSYKFDLTIW